MENEQGEEFEMRNQTIQVDAGERLTFVAHLHDEFGNRVGAAGRVEGSGGERDRGGERLRGHQVVRV